MKLKLQGLLQGSLAISHSALLPALSRAACVTKTD